MTKRKAVVSVVTILDRKILWHTRKGLDDDRKKATEFKTIEHALKLCRKKYRKQLNLVLLSWEASEL